MAVQGSSDLVMQQSADDTAKSNPSLEVRHNEQVFKEQFSKLFNSERLSDIILHVGDDRYYAHRFLLSVNSEVFEAMLTETRWQESKQSEVTLTEVDECVGVFHHFLKYMYTGSVELTTDTVLPVLLLADKYCLPVLSQTCVEYMLHHVVQSPDTNRTLSWYQYAKITGNTLLVDKCRKFIMSNFDIILKTSDWIKLDKEEVLEFMGSSDLVVNDEFSLWQKIENWLLMHDDQEDFPSQIQEVVKTIRFSMIPPKQLLEVEKSEVYVEHKVAFVDELNAAYRHHSLVSNDVAVKVQDQFRNYTSMEYRICYDLTVNHTLLPKHQIIQKDIHVPIDFTIADPKTSFNKFVSFHLSYWPKGRTPSIFWGHHRIRDPSLTVGLSLKILNQIPKGDDGLEVMITYIVYGKRNGTSYVAYSYINSFTFKDTDRLFKEDQLFLFEKLNEENSPYIVEHELRAKLFVKFVKEPNLAQKAV